MTTERPILFSAPMIRAILAGTKTQTRRAVKPQPTHPHFGGRLPFMLLPDDEGEGLYLHSSCLGQAIRCRYGRPGDRLYVRETWAVPHRYDHLGPSNIPTLGVPTHYAATEDRGGQLWRPSIHMPRWASRITLEVTGVCVERLADISDADAIAEGIGSRKVSENESRWLNYMAPDDAGKAEGTYGDPRHSFWSLWESINGRPSRDANPWLWVVEFRRVTP